MIFVSGSKLVNYVRIQVMLLTVSILLKVKECSNSFIANIAMNVLFSYLRPLRDLSI